MTRSGSRGALGPFANAVATWRLPHAAFPLVRCQGSRLLHLRHSHPQRVKSVALRTIDPDENEQSVAGCEPSERLRAIQRLQCRGIKNPSIWPSVPPYLLLAVHTSDQVHGIG